MMRSNTIGLAGVGAMLACASSAPGPTYASKKLNALSTADMQSLCDWTAQQEGGYGIRIPCDAGPGGPDELEGSKDQATCVAEYSQHFLQATCTQTAGDWMGCIKWRLTNWCSNPEPPPTGVCEEIQVGCYGDAPPDGGAD